ncbi:MAG: DUF4416 family protein [Spirochaetes bacterium]|nr:DUF4416 family protein [Spirochaetota bacterium]
MAEPIIPPPAKLFIGILTAREEIFEQARKILEKKYGDIDFATAKIPFVHTNYYSTLGKNIFKVLFSFKKLIKREDIVDIKLYTNKIEKKFLERDKRLINIDPGYLTLSNVFLATCKDYFHRAYLSRGVFLENELKFIAKRYEPWEWTYPDYRKPEYLHFFYNVRRIYYNQLKNR